MFAIIFKLLKILFFVSKLNFLHSHHCSIFTFFTSDVFGQYCVLLLICSHAHHICFFFLNSVRKCKILIEFKILAVPRKGFRSADCDTLYAIYLSIFTQSADPSPFGFSSFYWDHLDEGNK